MPFFIRNKQKSGKIGKRNIQKSSKPPPVKIKRQKVDENIESDSDVEVSEQEGDGRPASYSSDEEQQIETAQEKKLRLAKQYIEQLKREEADKLEDKEIDDDVIASRLKRDILEKSQKLHYDRADNLLQPEPELIKVLRGHKLSVTCIVISSDDRYIYSASKDCSIIKWDVKTCKKVQSIAGGRKGTEKSHIGHTSHILSLAITTDSKYLASGDVNNLLKIWNPDTLQHIKTFHGHRGPVSGLSFRKGTHQLFSASHDRSVKIWNLDEMSYVETLFGHQDSVTSIDSLTRERAVTCGGRDNSIRVWKVVEESQLVFNGKGGSIDCVALIDEASFITGHDNNSLALWSVLKKKAVFTRYGAHGEKQEGSKFVTEENWITSVASLQYSDVVASGSKDGCIRVWKVGRDMRFLHLLYTVPVKGFVNSMKFSNDGKFLVAGVGQEHRLGRWWSIKEARNSVCIIPVINKPTDITDTSKPTSITNPTDIPETSRNKPIDDTTVQS
ncbi:hypothetical protein SNE40_014974 [Patella caerulea]|uniref:U3 small nucleolar RNA-interacting protein 2 n=1 Tax=Patella caerulea TaxID=87958 RepID=A0AAN8JFQ1_PATCE